MNCTQYCCIHTLKNSSNSSGGCCLVGRQCMFVLVPHVLDKKLYKRASKFSWFWTTHFGSTGTTCTQTFMLLPYIFYFSLLLFIFWRRVFIWPEPSHRVSMIKQHKTDNHSMRRTGRSNNRVIWGRLGELWIKSSRREHCGCRSGEELSGHEDRTSMSRTGVDRAARRHV